MMMSVHNLKTVPPSGGVGGAGPQSVEQVLEQVRIRGWGDSLWIEVGRLRREEDVVRIFQAFSSAGALRFPGDVLRALLNMSPYPVPANRPQVVRLILSGGLKRWAHSKGAYNEADQGI
jgi:hypothetical protein